MQTMQHQQQGNAITIDLNGNDSLPMTKAGAPSVLRSHAVMMRGKITDRLFSQEQVAQIKATGQWITKNDRDWTVRKSAAPWKLVSPEEMREILKTA
jgi:hypothetical protein